MDIGTQLQDVMDIRGKVKTIKMFFLQQNNNKFSTNLTSLMFSQFFSGNDFPKNFRKPLICDAKKETVVRRMSLLFLPNKRGSMTLEAALVLPVFIFFIINLFSVMEMLRFHGNVTLALRNVGNKLAVYGYLYDQVIEDEEVLETTLGGVAFSYLYIKRQMEDYLGEDYLENVPVMGGKGGLIFAKADIMEDDIISLVLTYRVKMPFVLSKLYSVRTFNYYYARAWTGYKVADRDETYAYVTETGSVYHTNKECTHILLSIKETTAREVLRLRNDQGEKYTPCEKCGDIENIDLYITSEGNRYHGSLLCSGLKRTVYEIAFDEAKEKGYNACSRCGK